MRASPGVHALQAAHVRGSSNRAKKRSSSSAPLIAVSDETVNDAVYHSFYDDNIYVHVDIYVFVNDQTGHWIRTYMTYLVFTDPPADETLANASYEIDNSGVWSDYKSGTDGVANESPCFDGHAGAYLHAHVDGGAYYPDGSTIDDSEDAYYTQQP